MKTTEEGKKEVSFYEYVTTPPQYHGKEYPLSKLGEYIRDLPTFPKRSINKQEIYDFLRNIGAYKYILKDFEKYWESYVRSDKSPREVKKQAWEEERAQHQKEDTYLIKKYVSEIRNEVEYHDQSYEDVEEYNAISEKRMNERGDKTLAELDKMIEEDDIINEKPEEMSNEEWIKKKQEIRANRAQNNIENKTDQAISTHTPWWIFHQKADAIWCDCKPEYLRRGIYCKTCRLVLKVDKYMMELFKDASEGRLSSR